jgi:hypothetical protein
VKAPKSYIVFQPQSARLKINIVMVAAANRYSGIGYAPSLSFDDKWPQPGFGYSSSRWWLVARPYSRPSRLAEIEIRFPVY